MADLIIRGMEMPRDCSVCALSQKRVFANSVMCSITGQTVGYYDQGFHLEKHDCHLLPLPEGHGRLIDADAMERNMSETVQGDIRGYPYSDTQWDMAFRWIDHQPTIVPAEGGNADG